MNKKTQIIATLGKSSDNSEVFKNMISAGMNIVRFNFSWGDFAEKSRQVQMIRSVEKEMDVRIPIIADLSGPRIQEGKGHSYDKGAVVAFTERDKECVKFAVEQGVEYLALSFVGSPEDVLLCRKAIEEYGGNQQIISKIERKKAIDVLEEIINVSDVIMVARGDLSKEVLLEDMPAVQADIVERVKSHNKPVIVATGMLISMTDNLEPTHLEVLDVSNAVTQGADVIMLSEETASGKYPVEVVEKMSSIIIDAEKSLNREIKHNPLS